MAALRLPSSASARIRSRLTEVSAVSDAAAKAASTSDASSTAGSRLTGKPLDAATATRLTGSSAEELADAAALMDADDRLGDERRHAEHAQPRMVVEVAGAAVQRDGVGDADLVDGRIVEAAERAVGEHAVGGHDVDARRPLGAQRDRGAGDGAPGADEVVDDDAVGPVDVADDVDHLDGVV